MLKMGSVLTHGREKLRGRVYLVLTGGRFLNNCEFVNFVTVRYLNTEQTHVVVLQEHYHTETLAEIWKFGYRKTICSGKRRVVIL